MPDVWLRRCQETGWDAQDSRGDGSMGGMERGDGSLAKQIDKGKGLKDSPSLP